MSLKQEGSKKYIPEEVDPSPKEVYEAMLSKGLIPEEEAVSQPPQPLDEKSQSSSQP